LHGRHRSQGFFGRSGTTIARRAAVRPPSLVSRTATLSSGPLWALVIAGLPGPAWADGPVRFAGPPRNPLDDQARSSYLEECGAGEIVNRSRPRMGDESDNSVLCQMARSGKTDWRRRSVTVGTISNSATPSGLASAWR